MSLNTLRPTNVPAHGESKPVEPLRCSAVLTHHWLVRRRGGEKVLEACAELLPDSPIYTLVHDPSGIASSPLAARPIHTSCLQRLPGATRHYPKLLPLLPWAARRMKLPPVDLVLCSDAAIAKAMTPGAQQGGLLLPFADAVCVRGGDQRGVSPDAAAGAAAVLGAGYGACSPR